MFRKQTLSAIVAGAMSLTLAGYASAQQDNSRGGRTGETLLQAYKLNGTYLWTINLGKNIREGAHYTQFMVYDLDGDGKAEIVCKTADGTVDGAGKVLGDPKADWVYPDKPVTMTTTDRNGQKRERQVNPTGHVMTGPEYLTVFEGATGRVSQIYGPFHQVRFPNGSCYADRLLFAELVDEEGHAHAAGLVRGQWVHRAELTRWSALLIRPVEAELGRGMSVATPISR